MNVNGLPPRVADEVRRILNSEARRLLAEKLDRDAIGTAAGTDSRTLDRCADQRPPAVEGQTVPIGGGVDGDDGAVPA